MKFTESEKTQVQILLDKIAADVVPVDSLACAELVLECLIDRNKQWIELDDVDEISKSFYRKHIELFNAVIAIIKSTKIYGDTWETEQNINIADK